jgi:hypothetical protein
MQIEVGAVGEQDAVLIDRNGTFFDADHRENPRGGGVGKVEQHHIGGTRAGIAIGVGPLVWMAGNAFVDREAGIALLFDQLWGDFVGSPSSSLYTGFPMADV